MNYERQGGLKKVVSSASAAPRSTTLETLTNPPLLSSEMSAASTRPPSKLKLAFQPGEAVTEERLAEKMEEMKIFMGKLVQRAVKEARRGEDSPKEASWENVGGLAGKKTEPSNLPGDAHSDRKPRKAKETSRDQSPKHTKK